MLARGRPSRSIVRAHTSSACVESSPPETPITSFFSFDACMRCASAITWIW